MCDWLMETKRTEGEWSSVWVESGTPFVPIAFGPTRMHKLCVGSWDTRNPRVRMKPNLTPLILYILLPYSTEITPTLIACYKAATGGMGLISKTVVCLEITPTHEEAKSFLYASEACEACQHINIQQ